MKAQVFHFEEIHQLQSEENEIPSLLEHQDRLHKSCSLVRMSN